ncbi:MAG: nucleotidyltransferase domain-containing protein [Candidatus Zixiibacteriota bacterium]|nr:MAG: nucleotidyltransferase domain-containing protein [candidate division Zixibacteria bacterium]
MRENIRNITKELFGDIDLIFMCEFGSHLYGTNTENSDRDYKGVFVPAKEDCYLNRIPKSLLHTTKKDNAQKNDQNDIDIELYSIQNFLKLLSRGDTGALDILHASSNPRSVIGTSNCFQYLYEHRSDFYTKNLKAFVGYCRTQAAKYGIKGSRLNDSKRVLDFLESKNPNDRMVSHWDSLPTGEHLKYIEDDIGAMYEVCGRKIQPTVTIGYALNIVRKFYDNYGKRAQKAANNEGIDWKAVSHALRCAHQMKSIYETGDILFPLKESEDLIKIKKGEMDYTTQVAPMLDNLMDEVEELCEKSTLPKKVDIKKWERWLLKLYL